MTTEMQQQLDYYKSELVCSTSKTAQTLPSTKPHCVRLCFAFSVFYAFQHLLPLVGKSTEKDKSNRSEFSRPGLPGQHLLKMILCEQITVWSASVTQA